MFACNKKRKKESTVTNKILNAYLVLKLPPNYVFFNFFYVGNDLMKFKLNTNWKNIFKSLCLFNKLILFFCLRNLLQFVFKALYFTRFKIHHFLTFFHRGAFQKFMFFPVLFLLKILVTININFKFPLIICIKRSLHDLYRRSMYV